MFSNARGLVFTSITKTKFKIHDGGYKSKEWYDVKGKLKEWHPNPAAPLPFKLDWRSPLRDLDTGDRTEFIRIDPAHTYAIDGIGKSFLASGIIALARMGWFGLGKIECRLDRAYARFIACCEAHGKSTSIIDFSYKTFKLPQNSSL